jgi:serine/threonine protein kinase
MEDACGTPGYCPLKLLSTSDHLDNYGYTNKVDVLALGCILYELIDSAKPFSSDIVVLTHYQQEETVAVTVDPLLKSM